MTLPTLLAQVEALGDFPRKLDILQMIQTNNLEDAKALVRRLYESSGASGPELAPGINRVGDTRELIIYSKLEDMLDDYICSMERRVQ